MHTTPIPEDVRLGLSTTLALVEENRMAIMDRVQEQLASQETDDEAFGQAEITAMMLVNLLVECARELVHRRELCNLDLVAREHRRLEIDGRHYSRFGMVLGPVLRDAIGPALSPATASAWCDAFWFVIREIVGHVEIARPKRVRNHAGF